MHSRGEETCLCILMLQFLHFVTFSGSTALTRQNVTRLLLPLSCPGRIIYSRQLSAGFFRRCVGQRALYPSAMGLFGIGLLRTKITTSAVK